MLIVLVLLLAVISPVASNLTYQILVHQPHSPQKNYIGKLYLTILNQHQTIEARVESDGKKLIEPFNQSELANNPLIVEFVPIKSEYLEYTKRVYRTSLTEFVNYPHGEKIAIVVGSDLKTLHINSINYVQVTIQLLRLGTALMRFTVKSFTLKWLSLSLSNMLSLPKKPKQNRKTNLSSANMYIHSYHRNGP